jgi:hypothetical protein
MAKENKKIENKEPIMLVRPAVRRFGLDYLHVTLIILVIILAGLAFALSHFSPGSTVLNCPYGLDNNSTCVTPHSTSAQALASAESIIASYAETNSSYSLLPYYSEANKANVSYITNQSEWLVVVPFVDPLNENVTSYISMQLYDSNLTLARISQQIPSSPYTTQNQAVAFGAVSLAGKTACLSNVTPVYAFIDPYAPGATQGMLAGVNASNKFGSAINLTYKFIFTGSALSLYKGYGINTTQQDALDLWCASVQQNRFAAFLANYSIVFTGTPPSNSTLQQVAIGSGLNMTQFGSCLSAAPSILDNQALFASYYNVQTTPTYIVNCKYQTIPETLNSAIQYALTQKG